jgi:eukaryotic-like serine/threonine-protein kinase
MRVSRSRPPEELPRALRARGGRVYELLECVGSGGAGKVYRAVDAQLDYPREVGIKCLSLPEDRASADDLLREARLLSSVRHSNVVALLGAGVEESGGPFLVLELVSGLDLRTLSRRRAGSGDGPELVPWRLAVHAACAILRALGAVGRAVPGMVHRDVTPQNVLVSSEGEVKLADFGIAGVHDGAVRLWPNVVRGKIGYMAPEQIRGECLDVRADLFALGVVLYELLAGRRPAAHKKGVAELVAMERGQMTPLSIWRPDLPPGLLGIVDRLLEPVAPHRYGSADEALRALAPYGAGEIGPLRLADLVRRAACPDPHPASPRSKGATPRLPNSARASMETSPEPSRVRRDPTESRETWR